MTFNSLMVQLRQEGVLCFEHTDAKRLVSIRRQLEEECRKHPRAYKVLESSPYRILIRKVWP